MGEYDKSGVRACVREPAPARLVSAPRSGVELPPAACSPLALVPRDPVLPVLALATGMRVLAPALPLTPKLGLFGTAIGAFGLDNVLFLVFCTGCVVVVVGCGWEEIEGRGMAVGFG